MTMFDRSEKVRWYKSNWGLTLSAVAQVLSFTAGKHRNTVRFQILIVRARVCSLTSVKTKTTT